MILKNWQLKAKPPLETVNALGQSLNISSELATMLVQRGIDTFEAAKSFFRPNLAEIHDPFLMKDMGKAVARLEKAINFKEKIMVFGDYDVDGTTSVSLMYDFLSKIHSDLIYYVPDRYIEGYGISKLGIDTAHEGGISLIIALDCGIKSVDKISYANSLNIDFIICDHHNPGSEVPAAVAVLDPKQIDCPYPFKELTGCGVGFKLLQAYSIKNNLDVSLLNDYLDFVVTSISCDIVPIIGENRILSYYGLKKINENPRTSLKVLREAAGVRGEMTIENVVFGFGPRINAAGRIAHAKKAIELMLETDEDQAKTFVASINQNNTDRKKFDESITAEAISMIENNDWLLNEAKSTVLFSKDWHKGVVGIVASRCIEKYYRPTIILTESNGKATGSARSVAGFDLYDAIDACSDLIEQWGGHMHAAGMTLTLENVVPFQKKFDKIVSERITAEQQIQTINIDLEVDLSMIDFKFFGILKQMSPFGPMNMQPVFCSKGVHIVRNSLMKMKEKHLKFQVADPETGVTFQVIGFGMVDSFYEKLSTSKTCDICYTLDINEFRDQKTLQLMLKDVKF